MELPIVDTFTKAYEAWNTRTPTIEEMRANRSRDPIKVALIESVANPLDAANYMAKVHCDNCLSNHIQTALGESLAYKEWQRAMPSSTPTAIARYQKDYQNCDLSAVSKEIDKNGRFLSSGQCLFHGGLWPGGDCFVTKRPLSTSLCPQVTLRNAEFKAKAYEAGRLDLIVLRAINPTAKCFVFKRKGTNLGHESEVLIAAGACLTRKTENLIHSHYKVAKYDHPAKEIPIYVLEVDVS